MNKLERLKHDIMSVHTFEQLKELLVDLIEVVDGENTTYEYCSCCEREVEIPADTPSRCPNCDQPILPCSTCWDDIDGITRCDWSKEKRCWRFPKEG
ncbi:hypothetical protein SAMN05446037_1006138 [Anaerovirgula multivorans]|uniref:Uncharacterized protein n=1 Tax=Anaerovirgula multivorans TaxID=312168 RepID=A0A239CTV5_9FIRM|nr:hypothetical protein [Anaerovirgula multivorans]SNS23282.1 hypothetical protein SAMN05446037_1006138 [Anaerovirgula multivorans]